SRSRRPCGSVPRRGGAGPDEGARRRVNGEDGLLSLDESDAYLARTFEVPDGFDRDTPLGEQGLVDSVSMIELAIVLEEDLGILLADVADLHSISIRE